MGAWHFWFFLQANIHAHKIPCFGGVFWGLEVAILVLWTRGFSEGKWRQSAVEVGASVGAPHTPRDYYLNKTQGHISCDCNCNLAAKIILEATSYVIVIDAFAQCATLAHANIVSLDHC